MSLPVFLSPARRRLAGVGLAVAGLALLMLLAGAVSRHRARSGLARAIAETDENYPGWRLADLEGARLPVPDAENGALCVLAAAELLPDSWPRRDLREVAFGGRLGKTPTPAQVALVRAELARVGPALREARKL